MKKSYLLSGLIVFGVIVGINASENSAEYTQPSIERVQKEKLARQQELARPPVYKMIDPLVAGSQFDVDWSAVFKILDSMRGVINVNEYRTASTQSLLGLAVAGDNLLAVNKLLETYKANPNLPADLMPRSAQETPLMLACARGDMTKDSPSIVMLLLKYGANPNMKDKQNYDSFYYAENKPAILKILNQFKK